MSSLGAMRRRCDPDALSDFNQVSCLAFNMTICGTTPAAVEPRTLPFPPKHCQHYIISLSPNDWLAAMAC